MNRRLLFVSLFGLALPAFSKARGLTTPERAEWASFYGLRVTKPARPVATIRITGWSEESIQQLVSRMREIGGDFIYQDEKRTLGYVSVEGLQVELAGPPKP